MDRRRWATPLVLVAVALFASCGQQATPVVTSTTQLASTTTSPPATTIVSPPTTTGSPATTVAAVCSAATQGLTAAPVTGLPQEVADARQAIIAAAIACDYEALAAIALSSELGFIYSFGGGQDPALYWRDLESHGDAVLADLVRILNMSSAEQETQFQTDVFTTIRVWPAAFADSAGEADWAEVAQILSAEEVARMKEFGGYIGWRAGITADGDWVFFVAGD